MSFGDDLQHEREPRGLSLESLAETMPRGRTDPPLSSGRRWLGVLAMLLALAVLAWAAWHFVIRPRVGTPASTVPQQGTLAPVHLSPPDERKVS